MRPVPDWWADARDGTHHYASRLRLTATGVDPLVVHPADGELVTSAAGIPQHTLRATLAVDATEQPHLDALLAAPDTTMTITATVATVDGRLHTDLVAAPTLYVQQVTRRYGPDGPRVEVLAVDILGRLAANGLTAPQQTAPGSTVRYGIEQLLNACGHPDSLLVRYSATANPLCPPDAVYDGDGVAAAVELADLAGGMLKAQPAQEINPIRVIDTPDNLAAGLIPIVGVESYVLEQTRTPNRVIVATSSANGAPDVRGEAVRTGGLAPGGRYGTVTATYSRPGPMGQTDADRAARGLLRRSGGRRAVLREVVALPDPALEWGDPVQVPHDQAPPAVVWGIRLPLGPAPMTLTMRTPEDT